MLTSLPCDLTWETLIINLLLSTSNTKPLASADITLHLMQEYHCIFWNQLLRLCPLPSFSSCIQAHCGLNSHRINTSHL